MVSRASRSRKVTVSPANKSWLWPSEMASKADRYEVDLFSSRDSLLNFQCDDKRRRLPKDGRESAGSIAVASLICINLSSPVTVITCLFRIYMEKLFQFRSLRVCSGKKPCPAVNGWISHAGTLSTFLSFSHRVKALAIQLLVWFQSIDFCDAVMSSLLVLQRFQLKLTVCFCL